MLVRSIQGDTVDQLCWRHLGRTAGVTEQTYALNPGLAAIGPVLPNGTPVTLPDLADLPAESASVKLWD